jgi:hypothetical protein
VHLNDAMQRRRQFDESELARQALRTPLRLCSTMMTAPQWTLLRRAATSTITTTTTTTTTLSSSSNIINNSSDARLVNVLRLNGYVAVVGATQSIVELTHVPVPPPPPHDDADDNDDDDDRFDVVHDLLELLSMLVDEQIAGVRGTPRTKFAFDAIRRQQQYRQQQSSNQLVVDSTTTINYLMKCISKQERDARFIANLPLDNQ